MSSMMCDDTLSEASNTYVLYRVPLRRMYTVSATAARSIIECDGDLWNKSRTSRSGVSARMETR